MTAMAMAFLLAVLPTFVEAQDGSLSDRLVEPDLERLEPLVAEQLGAARVRLMSLLQSDGGVPQAALVEAYGDLGRIYAAYELDEAALGCLTAARDLDPDNYRWRHLVGFVAARNGALEEAEVAFREVLDLQPGYVPAAVRLADLLLMRGEGHRAASLLTQAAMTRPEEASVMDRLGEVALSRKDYEGALHWFGLALELAPAANRLHYSMALAYRGLGQLDEARSHLALRGDVGVRPRDPVVDEIGELVGGVSALLIRGRMAYRAGRYEEAAEAFAQAAQAAPENVPARVNLGAALAEAGRHEEARSTLQQALAITPGSVPARFNLGRVLRAEGDLAGALQAFDEAIMRAPEDSELHVERARTLQALDRGDDAAEAYERAIDLDPAAEEAVLEAAGLLMNSGRSRDAAAMIESALRVRPASAGLGLALVRLLAAGPDLEARDGARALELGREMLRLHGTLAHAEAVAMALAETGDCSAAAAMQTSVLERFAAEGVAVEIDRVRALSIYEAGQPCRLPGRESSER